MTSMWIALPSWAVLSEYNLDQTLIALSADMEALQTNIGRDLRRFEDRQTEFRNKIATLEETCDETGVMLYSQDERYLYGTLQATQGMKDVIRRIHSQKYKLDQLEADLVVITERYRQLSEFLRDLESRHSTPQSRKALHKSAIIADSLQIAVDSCLSSVATDKIRYQNLVLRADRIEKYNNNVLQRAQTMMFGKSNESLADIISHFPSRATEFENDLNWRFFTGQNDMADWNSKEDQMYDYMNIKLYIAIAIALCFYILSRFTHYISDRVADKRIYWALCLFLMLNVAGTLVILAIIGVAPMLRIILMLDAELDLLALLIVVSLTIRLKKGRIGRALISYLPMFGLTYMLIGYREDLVPLSTVTFTAPFVFILAIICQLLILSINLKKLDQTDRHMAWANTFVIGISCVLVCLGYTIFVSLMYLLWSGLVTGVLFLELINTFMQKYRLKQDSVADLTVRLLLYPLAIPAILFVTVLWVSHVYNLTSWLLNMMNSPFVNMPDKIGVVSIAKILYIYCLGIMVNYALNLARLLLHRNSAYRQGQVALWISIGNIFVWLCYAIAVIHIVDINKAGLIAAVGGASVGIGFAMKNTFENFFSGLSLMTGRVRPGDILEYENVRGKVLDIGIISTQMETEDGPIMTMPNRQLFEKNFKNMTRNHHVELRHIVFDISSGNDPQAVRSIILDSFRDIDGVDNSRQHVVILRNFGSGVMRVELKVWIDSEKYLATEPAIREAIFEAFKQNNIQAATFLEQIASKGNNTIMTT